jgi:hypothetical protein
MPAVIAPAPARFTLPLPALLELAGLPPIAAGMTAPVPALVVVFGSTASRPPPELPLIAAKLPVSVPIPALARGSAWVAGLAESQSGEVLKLQPLTTVSSTSQQLDSARIRRVSFPLNDMYGLRTGTVPARHARSRRVARESNIGFSRRALRLMFRDPMSA